MNTADPYTAMISRPRLAALHASEDREFRRRTARSRLLHQKASAHMPRGVPMSWMAGLYRTPPIYIAGGHGATFSDVDGNKYLDFNLCDLSMTIGYGNEVVAGALAAQARKGAQTWGPSVSSAVNRSASIARSISAGM